MPYIPALKYHFLTPIYDVFFHWTLPEKRFRNDLVALANIHDNQRILDYGCGTATLTMLLKKANLSCEVVGLEVDKQIFETAQRKVQANKVSIDLLFYDGRRIPFSDNYFDTIIASFVFDHLTLLQKIRSLHEIYRVLKPNGTFLVADWGLPQNKLMRMLFGGVQMLDNFRTTADLVAGKLPLYFHRCGFEKTSVCKKYATIFGTFELMKTTKP